MKPPSLRLRLLLLLVGGALVVAAAGGLVLERIVPPRIVAGFDQELLGNARALATLTRQTADGLELDFADEFMPEFQSTEDPQYFQVEGDELVELSRTFVGVPEGARLARAPPASRPRYADVTLPDGRPGRQVQVDFVPQLSDELEHAGMDGASAGWLVEPQDGSLDIPSRLPEGRVLATVIVARERGSLDGRILFVRTAIALTGAAVVAAVAALAALALSLGLRPVGRLARDVSALDGRGLGARLGEADLPVELVPIARQVNELLGRIAATVERERQLTSDMAHDLKTPVAELRTLCDVGARWPSDREATVRFFHDARDVAVTMERTIERLLALARHDAGRESVAREEVDVAAVLRAAAAAHAPEASARGLSLRIDATAARVSSDRARLGQIVANLIENAVAHADPGEVTCSVRDAGSHVTVRIENLASGLAPGDLAHVFERFWRKDAARGDRAHAGLGLALARANAELLGLDLRASLPQPGSFAVTLDLPRKGARAV